ncbi:hypothetical protein ACFYYI_09990 [Streptomyces sp. NPDC002387]|uniref:Uncharacterized protein n=1 Tax=Streptomyces lannensis TaxID=766498 RepID=A0ABP7JV14_9ACTN
MTSATPPPMPDFPPPPPAPKKSRTNLVIIGSAAAVIAAVIGTGVVVVQSRGDDSRPAAVTKSASEEAVTPAAEPDPTPTYTELTADSFTVKLRTTERQCFGSAGCNVTVEPKLTFLGDTEEIDPDATYEITYEIHGDESGPVIETAELTDRTSLNYTPSLISTSSSRTKVSVEIADITQGG